MAPKNKYTHPELRSQAAGAGILPWPEALIVENATLEDRRAAITELYGRVSKSQELSLEMQFFACGQLAILRQLVDLMGR